MKSKRNVQALGQLFIGMLAVFTLGACGGGGGGDNSGYSGVTSQAMVTTANAKDLAVNAYQGGPIGQSLVSPLDLGAVPAAAGNRLLDFAALTRNLALQIHPGATGGVVTPQAMVPVTETDQGSCGGTVQFNATVDDVTGNYTGSAVYTGYCDAGVTLNGTEALSGQVDTTTGDLMNASTSFQGLSVSDATGSATLSGTETLELTNDGLNITQTIDVVLRDNADGKTYWINNYRLDLSLSNLTIPDIDISSSGRFYDPEQGYVEIVTQTPLHIPNGAEDASSGVLVFLGAENSSARLTVNGDGTYLIEADADGNGSYEWSVLYTPN